jgi:hypothetical protein
MLFASRFFEASHWYWHVFNTPKSMVPPHESSKPSEILTFCTPDPSNLSLVGGKASKW